MKNQIVISKVFMALVFINLRTVFHELVFALKKITIFVLFH